MKVLVTGGRSQIARSIVKRRCALADDVVVTASTPASLSDCAAAYRSEGLDVRALRFDLADPEAADPALEAVIADGVDALILNAWTRRPPRHRLHEIPHAEVREDLHTNVLGHVWLLQKVLPGMTAAGFGRIVLISSVSAVSGTGRYGPYILGKAALEGLIRNLAVDYGSANVLCNTVRLGLMKTERTEAFWSRPRYVERMRKVIPQGALGEPDDVGPALDPLLAERQYINGAVLEVSGGLPMLRLDGVLGR